MLLLLCLYLPLLGTFGSVDRLGIRQCEIRIASHGHSFCTPSNLFAAENCPASCENFLLNAKIVNQSEEGCRVPRQSCVRWSCSASTVVSPGTSCYVRPNPTAFGCAKCARSLVDEATLEPLFPTGSDSADITRTCATDGTWLGPEPICGSTHSRTARIAVRTNPPSSSMNHRATKGRVSDGITSTSGTSIVITDPTDEFESRGLRAFDKFIDLFNGTVKFLGTERCTQESGNASVMIHAAKIFAEYLDGDRDGSPDNPAVALALGEAWSNTTITMFASQDDPAWIRFSPPDSPSRHYHDLECDETPEGGECSGDPLECFDNAHCELVQVLVNQGFAQVFPDIFAPSFGAEADDDPDDDDFPVLGTQSVTALNMQENIADCGYAFNRTFTYPNCVGHYHYSDRTCGFSCLVSEYNYWSLTSVLGGQEATNGRCDYISHEWELCTPEEMMSSDPAQYAVLNNLSYGLPVVWPTGEYE